MYARIRGERMAISLSLEGEASTDLVGSLVQVLSVERGT